MFTVELKKDEGFIKRLPAMSGNIKKALEKNISKSAIDLQRYIVQNKLNAAEGYSPTLLHVRSGDLRRSIQQNVVSTNTSVEAFVYSAGDVKYAAIHEYGGVINRFGKKVGDYQIHMPMRSFMRTSLAENKDDIIKGMNQAVMEGMKA